MGSPLSSRSWRHPAKAMLKSVLARLRPKEAKRQRVTCADSGVPAAACSDEWRQQFWADYQANPAFRAAVGSFYRLDEPPEGPDYGDAIGIALEAQSDVPIAISRSIEELQDLDVYIAEAHAGSTLRPPYLRSTTPIPGPLLALLKRLDSSYRRCRYPSTVHAHTLTFCLPPAPLLRSAWRIGEPAISFRTIGTATCGGRRSCLARSSH